MAILPEERLPEQGTVRRVSGDIQILHITNMTDSV